MAKKKNTKQKEAPKKPAENQSADTEDRDFGGFPDRDLKKNLGCG